MECHREGPNGDLNIGEGDTGGNGRGTRQFPSAGPALAWPGFAKLWLRLFPSQARSRKSRPALAGSGLSRGLGRDTAGWCGSKRTLRSRRIEGKCMRLCWIQDRVP